LSPRLYVGFGVGLFDPGQLVTLRYDVSDSFSVEAVTSDETTRAGVDYRVEISRPQVLMVQVVCMLP
jgi:translocation and assembly module TamB